MTPRFVAIPALLLVIACHKAPLPAPPTEDDEALWPVVENLASDAESLLGHQEELIWKYWVEGTPADIAKTYQGKEQLFSIFSIQAIDRLRRSRIRAYRCTAPAHGEALQCPKDQWGTLEVRALTHLQIYFVGEYLSRMLADQSDAVANLEASLTFTAGGKEDHYRDLERLRATEKDTEKRHALYLGATRAVERLSQLVRRKNERAEALVKELGYPTYESFGESLRFGSMEQLSQLAEQI